MGFGIGRSSLVQLLLTLIAAPLLYVNVLSLLIIIAITLPYRLFVYVMVKTFMTNVIGFVGGESAAMSTDPLHTRARLNIVQFYILDDVIPTPKFLQMFQERIIQKKDPHSGYLVYGKYQQYWDNIMGYNMWRWDRDFNLESHIQSSLESYTRKELPTLMSHFLEQPFKRGQSPWEITLIHNYKEEEEDGGGAGTGTGTGTGSRRGKMLVVNRTHHALADGLSLFHVFQRDLPNRLEPVNMAQPHPVEHSWWGKVSLLHLFMKDLINFFIDGYDPKNAWVYPLNSSSNPAQGTYFTSITSGIEVSQVSAVKNKYKVSYIAVLYHCILQGVRRILEEEARSVPDNVLIRYTRAKPDHPEGLCNHVYVTGAALSTVKTSAKSSLQNIEAELQKEKLSMLPIALDFLVKLNCLLPEALIKLILTHALPPGFSCTNMPVPKYVTSYDGVNMTDYFAGLGAFFPHRTLMIVAVGDGGRQNIVASVDQASYSSQAAFEKLGNYIKDEFNLLVESLKDN